MDTHVSETLQDVAIYATLTGLICTTIPPLAQKLFDKLYPAE